MGLYRIVSEINGDLSQKSQNFLTPVYFAPPLKEFPLELSIGAKSQKLEWWATRWLRKLMISLSVLIQYQSVTDRHTDRRMAKTGLA